MNYCPNGGIQPYSLFLPDPNPVSFLIDLQNQGFPKANWQVENVMKRNAQSP